MDSKIEENQDGQEKLKKQKGMFILVCVGIAIVALGIFVLLMNGYVNKTYDSYQVLSYCERQDSNTVQYLCVDGRLIKYSKDGISEITQDGESIWTGSYNMNNPQVVSCGKYILVANIGGKEAIIYNGEDTGTELSVDYEIQQACVSKQGVVALLLEDTSSNMIHIYNPYDVSSELLAEIPTNVEDGYPVAFALSPDGASVVASYLSVSSGKSESRVAFYNFSEVGQNKDCLVGAQNYQKDLITDVRFLDSSRVCLMGDGCFYIWSNMKKPEQTLEKKVKKEIRSVFYNEKYIGMITETGKEKNPYRMQLLDTGSGKISMETVMDNSYDHVSLEGNEILLSSSKEISVFKLNGVEKLNCTVEGNVSCFFKAKRRNRYYLLDETRIQIVKPDKIKNKS